MAWCDWSGDHEQFAALVAAAGHAEAMLEVRSARELCALPEPPQDEQLLGPLLLRGQRLVLGAHTGEGKTSMALQIVCALVTGGEFLDWQGSGGRVLVLDAEQGLRTVKRRLREVGLHECDDIDYVRVPDGLALDSDERHVAEVEQALERGNYTLVVADPLYRLHTGDSNDEREAVDLMRPLRRLARALRVRLAAAGPPPQAGAGDEVRDSTTFSARVPTCAALRSFWGCGA